MTPHNDNAPRLMSLNDAARVTSLSRSQINALRLAGLFPSAVLLGERRRAFVRTEGDAWTDDTISGRAA